MGGQGASRRCSRVIGYNNFMEKESKELVAAVRDLQKETQKLATTINNIEYRYQLSAFVHPWRYLILAFLYGLFMFLGSTAGVLLIVYVIGRLGFLPYIGSFFTDLKNIVAR